MTLGVLHHLGDTGVAKLGNNGQMCLCFYYLFEVDQIFRSLQLVEQSYLVI